MIASDALTQAEAYIRSLPTRLNADKTRGLSVTFGWTLLSDPPRPWRIKIDQGTCTAEPGEAEDAIATLSAKPEDFLTLMNGGGDPMRMMMTGKLKIKGNAMALGKFDEWFKSE